MNRLAPLILAAVLLAVWEAACRILAVPPYLLPMPSAIGAALVDRWLLLLVSAGHTLFMALGGLAVAALVAGPLAVLAASP